MSSSYKSEAGKHLASAQQNCLHYERINYQLSSLGVSHMPRYWKSKNLTAAAPAPGNRNPWDPRWIGSPYMWGLKTGWGQIPELFHCTNWSQSPWFQKAHRSTMQVCYLCKDRDRSEVQPRMGPRVGFQHLTQRTATLKQSPKRSTMPKDAPHLGGKSIPPCWKWPWWSWRTWKQKGMQARLRLHIGGMQPRVLLTFWAGMSFAKH